MRDKSWQMDHAHQWGASHARTAKNWGVDCMILLQPIHRPLSCPSQVVRVRSVKTRKDREPPKRPGPPRRDEQKKPNA